MKKKVTISLILGIFFSGLDAQNIDMNFPKFAGKNYDFIVFQGSARKTISQGTIPENGKFVLKIPAEYSPYTGMGQWLITGTQEGGGLDMIIPGRDFGVSCQEAQPTEDNIVYTKNNYNDELNRLYKEQQKILSQYAAMKQAITAFSKKDENYNVFSKEYQNQLSRFGSFQTQVSEHPNYPAKLLQIVNVSQGIGTQLLDAEEDRAKNITRQIADDIDFGVLYTSGHWREVISLWADVHTQVLKDPYQFVNDFAKIGEKITHPAQYTDFVSRVTEILTQQGKDNYVYAIAPGVLGSGKIKNYEGILAVFTKASIGRQAPDLIVNQQGKSNMILKSNELAGELYQKTVIIFYESGCGPCGNLLQQLPGNFANLKQKGVKIISISADEDKKVFKEKAKDFLWKDAFCDYEGLKGINFKNYAVAGTPTMVVLDKAGKILLRTASLEELLKYIK
jgi:peroxiredoxin